MRKKERGEGNEEDREGSREGIVLNEATTKIANQ